MKTAWFIVLVVALLIIAGTQGLLRIHGRSPSKTDGKGFAVLELFTSEGCSSCPPADRLMEKIQKETEGESVYILAYHVDYWDRLGWKDGFSSADYSKRQAEYGQWLHVTSIYTPQVIVNGKTQYVGSDESAIRQAIKAQLAAKPGATLALQAHIDKDHIIVEYQATQAMKNSQVLIAILQKAATTKVERGENAGQVLSHVQIVRNLQTEPLTESGNGKFMVQLPKHLIAQQGELMGLLQDQTNGEILAVAKANLK